MNDWDAVFVGHNILVDATFPKSEICTDIVLAGNTKGHAR